MMDGHRITVGWGKAVKPALPHHTPMVPNPAVPPAIRLTAPSAPLHFPSSSMLLTSPSSNPKNQPPPVTVPFIPVNEPRIIVRLPEDPFLRDFVDYTARCVAQEGAAFETSLRQRSGLNMATDLPSLSFLHEPQSLLGIYYRWRTYAYICGDTESLWQAKPFQMFVNGPWWVPPPLSDSRASEGDGVSGTKRSRNGGSNDEDADDEEAQDLKDKKYAGMTGAQIERAKKERRRAHVLSEDDIEDFENLLQALSVSNCSVREALGFVMDRAEGVVEMIDLIRDSILLPTLTIASKVARLYLLSDLLHNSMSQLKHASSFRTQIQGCLPAIFESFGSSLRAIKGRMSATAFEQRVLSVLRIWNTWCIFPPLFISGLESALLKTESSIAKILKQAQVFTGSGEAMDLDALMRQARFGGVSSTSYDGAPCSAAELRARIDYAEEIYKQKERDDIYSPALTHNVAMHANKEDDIVREEGNVDGQPIEDDDIDGEPLLDQIGEQRRSKSNEIDDVDGVPPLVGDDEIDGEPLTDNTGEHHLCADEGDDIDGMPLQEEEDDVDGMPLDC